MGWMWQDLEWGGVICNGYVCGGQGHPFPAPPLQQEEQRLTERCQSLDETVVRLTTFVRQNQVSLNHILVTQQKARWVTFECDTVI